MRKAALFLMVVFIGSITFSKDASAPENIYNLLNSLTFEQSGTVLLKDGIGKLTIPEGFKYLDPAQSETVLTELWGNPKSENMSLGLLIPQNHSLLDTKGYVFNIQYDAIGYVKDNDVGQINYEELLMQMQQKSVSENEKREDAGLEPVTLLGWAFKPYYDKNRKVLHWAKELKIGKHNEHVLNYQVRILGRNGVLVMNAIAPMSDLPLVQNDVNRILDAVGFTETYRYARFNPQEDKIAETGISGLISGNLLGKINLLGIFTKYWSLLLIALIAFFRPASDYIQELIQQNRKLSMR